MASNDYFDSSGAPSTGSHGSSLTMRTEFDAIEAGFIKLAQCTGNASLPVFINAAGTAQEAIAAATALTRLGLIDYVPSGDTILFYKDTAVTGYTLEDTLDDKVVYVTKGSVATGETGGGVHSTGSWTISGITVDAHTHTGPSHTHTGPSHTHTGPSHVHSVPIGASGGYIFAKLADGVAFTATKAVAVGGSSGSTPGTATTVSGSDATGASGTDPTGADGDDATSAASSSSITSAGAWRPAAYCFTMQTRT